MDWAARWRELEKIADWAKSRRVTYDCAVGVSGGKDSTVQALVAKERLGLHCLLVNCAPDGITDIGRANLENLVQHGFDMMSFRPNPRVMRQLTKFSFYEYGNLVKPSEYPLFAVTYRVALQMAIPLVIQGENPGLTLGVEGYDDNDDAMTIHLGGTVCGGNMTDWLVDGDGIAERDVLFYQFPSVPQMRVANMRAIFLQYYLENWAPGHNAEFAVTQGLTCRENHDPGRTGRLSSCSALDVDHLQISNQMLKYAKFGFGFVTDDVCYAIRDGVLDRETAIEFVERYDGLCGDEYVEKCCDYLGISTAEFWKVVARHGNKDLFNVFNGMPPVYWGKKFKVGGGL